MTVVEPVGRAPGRTTISARALEHLATGLARDSARVRRRDVTVSLADERGRLRVSVTVPVALTADAGRSLVERGEELRRDVIEGMQELAGRAVIAVDVRYAGARRIRERRVS